MAGRNLELLDDFDLELKCLKLDLVDMVEEYTNGKGDISFLWQYEEDIKKLVGIPPQEQRKELEAIVRAQYQSCNKGGRKNGR